MKLSLDNFLENSFVISCNAEQKDIFYSKMQELGIKSKHYDGNFPISYGLSKKQKCWLSHLDLVKMAKCLNLPYITIFEDDCVPMIGIQEKLTQFFDSTQIPDDVDILVMGNLGYIYDYANCIYYLKPTDIPTLAKVQDKGVAGAHAYMVFQKCYDKYISMRLNCKEMIPNDGMFATKHTKDIVVYSSVPSFFIQMRDLNVQHVSLLHDRENLNLYVNDVNALKNVKISSQTL